MCISCASCRVDVDKAYTYDSPLDPILSAIFKARYPHPVLPSYVYREDLVLPAGPSMEEKWQAFQDKFQCTCQLRQAKAPFRVFGGECVLCCLCCDVW